MTPRDDATEAQVQAAAPGVSTWLAANAGSGKTRVLTDRVARLLLDGVQPQHILCLTYTKAAASEMQNRLFRRLGAWAMLEDSALHLALQELGIDERIDDTTLREARRLFARALETPGGLKIQTIHSFCASLLRRFPLEAGVSPQFTEIEDRAAEMLRTEVLDSMADSSDAERIADLARHVDTDDLGALTAEIVRQAEAFSPPRSPADLLALCGLPPDFNPEAEAARVLSPNVARWLPEAIDILRGEAPTMNSLAEALARLDLASPGPADLAILVDALLKKGDGHPNLNRIPTKNAKTALGPLLEPFLNLMDCTAEARDRLLAHAAAERTAALHGFAGRFLARYEAEKQARGWLDFDDQIAGARRLLTDPAVAAWVLYRIDGGIDHILVDEAQDTSPAQWDVIAKLAAEFWSGAGIEKNTRRTLFVVGDKKQSIYSFQGADPREFDRMEAAFRERFEAAAQPFRRRSLTHSFRSAQAILRLVDQTFDGAEEAGFETGNDHVAFKANLPGRVDLWPVIPTSDTADEGQWDDPHDRQSDTHHAVLLAERIARQIKAMVDPANAVTIPEDGPEPGTVVRRAVRPGDFLILFRRRTLSSRNSLFASVIRALKAHDLPVAGADRLRVSAELAVRDLRALLAFLAMPEDSLALASALKSPLFGWDEAALYRLAAGRGEAHLWQVLRETDCEATRVLRDLRQNVDFLRPFELVERILTRHRGRRKFLARLGPEAEDGINALLAQALAYERSAVPSLTGFLVWMETDDMVVKRQVDSASNQIRVMTVHGAKGLESPIVILPDCGEERPGPGDRLLQMQGVPFWKPPAAEMPGVLARSAAALREDAERERLRLFYVALTRAEKWLIVAAAGDLPKNGRSWYQQAEAAFEHLDAVEAEEFGLAFRRYGVTHWTDPPLVESPREIPGKVPLPDWLDRPAPPVIGLRPTLSPSDLGGAKALPGEEGLDEQSAKAYGSLVHDLIDRLGRLPAGERAAAGAALGLDEPLAAAALGEAQGVLADPAFGFLFAPGVLSEVALSADLGPVRLYGIADRIVLTPERVTVVDFKTNRRAPETPAACPEGILRQMGAYTHALRQIYPDRAVEAAILWTGTARYMPLPHDTVTQALARTPYLDGVSPGP